MTTTTESSSPPFTTAENSHHSNCEGNHNMNLSNNLGNQRPEEEVEDVEKVEVKEEREEEAFNNNDEDENEYERIDDDDEHAHDENNDEEGYEPGEIQVESDDRDVLLFHRSHSLDAEYQRKNCSSNINSIGSGVADNSPNSISLEFDPGLDLLIQPGAILQCFERSAASHHLLNPTDEAVVPRWQAPPVNVQHLYEKQRHTSNGDASSSSSVVLLRPTGEDDMDDDDEDDQDMNEVSSHRHSRSMLFSSSPSFFSSPQPQPTHTTTTTSTSTATTILGEWQPRVLSILPGMIQKHYTGSNTRRKKKRWNRSSSRTHAKKRKIIMGVHAAAPESSIAPDPNAIAPYVTQPDTDPTIAPTNPVAPNQS